MPSYFNIQGQSGSIVSLDDILVEKDLFSSGTLYGWGRDVFGQIGLGVTSETVVTPVYQRTGSSWKIISTGFISSAGITDDGSLWTWGNNGYGTLGLNLGSGIANAPLEVTNFLSVGKEWRTISVGRGHACAIKSDGTLWTWGLNNHGQLGDNTTISRSSPITTFAGGANWKDVSCNGWHTLATKTDGTLWLWGRNTYGALATADLVDRSTPVTTFAGGNNWKQASAGTYGSTSIKTDGSLWTWGVSYACGIGTFGVYDPSTPVTTFAGGNDWKHVSIGYLHTSAIKNDGSLWTWGFNSKGQLGLGIEGGVADRPYRLGTSNDWKDSSCGYTNTVAVKTDGTLWVWGENLRGQLGIGNAAAINKLTPVTTFAGGNDWRKVMMGSTSQHVLALKYTDAHI
jgi:hypothetical protein